MTRRILHEAGTLVPEKNASGTYRVCLINEGQGSSGLYPRDIFTAENAAAFDGALSFMNHPLDPEKPHLRPAEDIAGRLVSPVVVEEHDGKLGLWSDYKPNSSNPQRAAFIAEYADALGLSIYIAASGREENDQYIIESFDGADPYRSVDVVVAAGRGGKFDRANESYRALETSANAEIKPDATSAQETQKKEEMEKIDQLIESVNALTASLAPVVTFVTESKTQAEASAQASVDDKAIAEALDAYEEKVATIPVKDLLPSQVESLRAEAKAGKDIAPLIESAKKVVEEATKHITESEEPVVYGRVDESGKTADASGALPKGW